MVPCVFVDPLTSFTRKIRNIVLLSLRTVETIDFRFSEVRSEVFLSVPSSKTSPFP